LGKLRDLVYSQGGNKGWDLFIHVEKKKKSSGVEREEQSGQILSLANLGGHVTQRILFTGGGVKEKMGETNLEGKSIKTQIY